MVRRDNPVSNAWYCHYLWRITEEIGLLLIISRRLGSSKRFNRGCKPRPAFGKNVACWASAIAL